jgi:hypothetical protein
MSATDEVMGETAPPEYEEVQMYACHWCCVRRRTLRDILSHAMNEHPRRLATRPAFGRPAPGQALGYARVVTARIRKRPRRTTAAHVHERSAEPRAPPAAPAAEPAHVPDVVELVAPSSAARPLRVVLDADKPEEVVAEEDACTICMMRRRDAVLLPCAHLTCCYECAQAWSRRGQAAPGAQTTCPTCRQPVAEVKRVYR